VIVSGHGSFRRIVVLTVTVHNVGNTAVLRCHGRIVHGEESALLCAAVQRRGQDIVVDLGGVSAIDAAGIGALVSLQAAGVYLQLMNATEPVRAILRLTGLDTVVEVCEAESIDCDPGSIDEDEFAPQNVGADRRRGVPEMGPALEMPSPASLH
jgi:anti-anti-sigma factor